MTTQVKKRKRGKGKHYITGVHHSPKCALPINYRSGWERTCCLILDNNPEVLSYEYESFSIPYVLNKKPHLYYPDFVVRYKDGRTAVVEVKRTDKLTNRMVIAKAAAARQWIIEQKKTNWSFEFWTSELVKAFQKLLEYRRIKSLAKPHKF